MYPTTPDFMIPALITIANGTALSNAIDIRRYPNVGYVMPAGWTAASIAFKVSLDGVNYSPLKSAAGTLIEHTTPTAGADARSIPVEAKPFAFVKIWSETAGANVNQGADRVFVVGTKG